MAEKIYISGFHKSGSGFQGKYYAKKHNVPYLDEDKVKMWDLNKALALADSDEGFVCHCPFLAHRCKRLADVGKIYWSDRRDTEKLLVSMRYSGILDYWYKVMGGFKEAFPDDPVWKEYHWEDEWNWWGHMVFIVKIKRYFYQKYIKPYAEITYMEDCPDYNEVQMLSYIKKIRKNGRKIMEEYERIFESWHLPL